VFFSLSSVFIHLKYINTNHTKYQQHLDDRCHFFLTTKKIPNYSLLSLTASISWFSRSTGTMSDGIINVDKGNEKSSSPDGLHEMALIAIFF